jgi:hypothetical protein
VLESNQGSFVLNLHKPSLKIALAHELHGHSTHVKFWINS